LQTRVQTRRLAIHPTTANPFPFPFLDLPFHQSIRFRQPSCQPSNWPPESIEHQTVVPCREFCFLRFVDKDATAKRLEDLTNQIDRTPSQCHGHLKSRQKKRLMECVSILVYTQCHAMLQPNARTNTEEIQRHIAVIVWRVVLGVASDEMPCHFHFFWCFKDREES